MSWPKRGKLSEMIVQSLKQNARAEIEVSSSSEAGMSVTLVFSKEAAAP
ncbi:Hypothetical protein NGAL_HAMBI2605_54630 [Neorhizobium galegae bv. orientalis]|nr:Hypothetical protein NGAL_HAMBI2566_48260 [Neorhizobium galegae bv. orientalis]CDZ67184.1 Hypothetical protein NGAL_HAMBI2605_54630 [Neorhizobium galegae bv. orientalis]